MKAGIIIQARLGSSRLPRKIFMKYKDERLIDHIIRECKKTKLPVILAMPEADACKLGKSIECGPDALFFGSENDVISRFYWCAKEHKFDPVIRVTGDAKHIKHELILQQLENYKKYKHICYGNFCEVFSFKELEYHYKYDKRPDTREHVTLGMLQDMTVDYEIDLK